jgi:hypothetical protein
MSSFRLKDKLLFSEQHIGTAARRMASEKAVYQNPNGMPLANGKNLHMDVRCIFFHLLSLKNQ